VWVVRHQESVRCRNICVLLRFLRFLSLRSRFGCRAPSPALALAEAGAFMVADSEVEAGAFMAAESAVEAAVFVEDLRGPVVAHFVAG
jgi:hypothetical protein